MNLVADENTPWNLVEEFGTPGGVVRWGSFGSGPPIVLIHGSPFSSRVWRDILPALSRSHTVYLWDLLGYGQSEQRSDHDVSIAAQARILADLLRYWKLGSPRIVGHDIGGAIGLRSHLFEGARYADLTLVDAVGGGDWGTGFFKLVRENATTFSQLPDYAHRAMIGSHLQRATYRGYRPGALEEYLAPWTGDVGQAAFYRQFAQAHLSQTDEIESHLGEVDVPTTVVWGRQDRLLTEEFADILRRGIPGAEFHWVERAGHLLQQDAPADLLAILANAAPSCDAA
jgi:pimeloyl-ACP methyl ester carboxylesterase